MVNSSASVTTNEQFDTNILRRPEAGIHISRLQELFVAIRDELEYQDDDGDEEDIPAIR